MIERAVPLRGHDCIMDLAARPLKGDGWSLELTKGWVVVPGERAGDAKLAQTP